jgi:trehalose/maltose hydrolase-like predicted phosphorylase
VNTWYVRENAFAPRTHDQHAHTVLPVIKQVRSQETVFTVGNGYFCTRGTFEEGYPHATAATLLYGVFDAVPIAKEELANVPDWTTIKLFVNGERFQMERGTILDYQRELNLRNGELRRSVLWQSVLGIQVRITAERFASLTDEHLGVVRYSVSVQDTPNQLPVDILLRASLEGGQGNYDVMHWETADQGHDRELIWLLSKTKMSNIQLAQAMSFNQTMSGCAQTFHKELFDSDLAPSIHMSGTLASGETLTTEKVVVMYTSRDGIEHVARTATEHLEKLVQEPELALLSLHPPGLYPAPELAETDLYDRLLAASANAWEQYWEQADVLLEGDDRAQLGLRYSLYQLRINVSTHDSRYSIAARGLTGFGYRGHVFHDTEIFLLPFFSYVLPDIARNLLLYRHHLLPAARVRAARNGYQGAQYPWESTLNGEETTPPLIVHPKTGEVIPVLNGTLELHITASIAYATWEYYLITGDDDFLRNYGAELLLSTAQYWVSRATMDERCSDYVINNVIGPDEWHEHVNNNAYTNAMARHNIEVALQAWQWLQTHAPDKAHLLQQQLGIDELQMKHWQEVVQRLRILQNPQSGLIEQFEGFFKLAPFDQTIYAERKDSYQGLLGMKEVQEHQIIKQADVLMLLTMLKQQFDLQTKQVNWEYYYPLTDHDYGSSLTPALHVIVASELGKSEAAYKLFMQGALVDLENQRGNTPDGIHMACSGAVWQAAVLGIAGLRMTEDGYTTTPMWPDGWTRLAFSFCHKGEQIRVDLRRPSTL